MNRLVAVLQLVAALALLLIAIFVLVNAILLATRPETISVINSFVGLGVMLVALTALSTLLFRRAITRLRAPGDEAGESGAERMQDDS